MCVSDEYVYLNNYMRHLGGNLGYITSQVGLLSPNHSWGARLSHEAEKSDLVYSDLPQNKKPQNKKIDPRLGQDGARLRPGCATRD